MQVNSFQEYIDLYTKDKQDEDGNPLEMVYENSNPRWEVGLTSSEGEFQQVSFVNSIATTEVSIILGQLKYSIFFYSLNKLLNFQGGRHVEHVVNSILGRLFKVLNKKHKDLFIHPNVIKKNLFIFINCVIVNPSFSSQEKHYMCLPVEKFGSKCTLSRKFFVQVNFQSNCKVRNILRSY